jgi:hypothetical protein
MDSDAGLGGDAFGDALGEFDAVDGERVARGDCSGIRFGEKDAARSTHLLFEKPGGCVFGLRF